MSKAEIEAVAALLRERAQHVPAAIPELRADFEEFTAQIPLPPGTRMSGESVGAIPAAWITAGDAANKYTILYLHGGGYVIGSARTHAPLAARLSEVTGARCLVPDYRLAPEHPFPAAVDDAVAAYRWLLGHGVDHKRIAVAGDSAGGGLVVAALVAARDARLPMPAAALSISPWADLTCDTPAMRTKASADPVITRGGALLFAKIYLNGADMKTPLASPIYADLHELPPMMIQVGECEVLLDDATRLAQRLRAAGVDVCFEQWDDMVHVWHLFAHRLAEGRQALKAAASFLKTQWRASAH
ncbi:MAG: alpha/beta hydrolase [Candidatus Hydrogenedentota bacterium]